MARRRDAAFTGSPFKARLPRTARPRLRLFWLAAKVKGVRISGGGRKKIIETNPDIKNIIEEIIEPETRGDPESPLRCTCKSVRNIADSLKKEGCDVSRQTVASILHRACPISPFLAVTRHPDLPGSAKVTT